MQPIPQRLALAAQHHQAGRLQEAEALYRGILQEAPRHPHALHLLGVLAHQSGRHQEAFDLINRALEAQGPHPVFLSNLAAVCLALNRLEDAVNHSGLAVRIDRNFADAYSNLGVALRRLNRLDEAEAAFRAALRANPNHVDARSGLGAVLHKKSRLPEALALLQDTVRLAPTHAQTRNDLGGVLLGLHRAEEALPHLQEAIRLRPTFHEAHANLGMALQALGRTEEALPYLREALRINPAYARGHDHLGHVLETQGKLDEALVEFQESQRLEPNNALALAGLSKLAVAGRFQLDEAMLRHMRQLAEAPNVLPDDRCRLLFSLAGWLDKSKAYDEAFEYYRRGNELRKEIDRVGGGANDLATQRMVVDRLIAYFTPDYFRRVAGFGSDSELPVFVVGMMRSGSTLTEQILASHPAVHAVGEAPDIPRLLGVLHQRIPGTEDYPDRLNRLDAPTALSVAEEHLQRLRQRGGAALRVVDKLLFNYLHLGVIATLFPRARVIHCLRDPVDTCLSCYCQNFAQSYLFKLELRDLGLYYREYERMMAHWTKVLPIRMHELHYEELTANQESETRRLLDYCGLEWDERCLNFTEAERTVKTASILQVRQPMYRSSVGRWRRYEKHLQPLLEALSGSEPEA